MSTTSPTPTPDSSRDTAVRQQQQHQQQHRDFFRIPPLIKSIFDTFPLRTYPPNRPPAHSLRPLPIPTLFIASNEARPSAFTPSTDPVCLKYQVYLHFQSIPFHAVSSSPSASPTNTLPMLLPPNTKPNPTVPITPDADRLWRYIDSLAETDSRASAPPGKRAGLDSPEVQAVLDMLDLRLWDVWALLVLPPPARFLSAELHPSPTAQRLINLYARSPDEIFSEAETCLDSLQTLLEAGGRSTGWFFGAEAPGPVDAAVWAYLDVLVKAGGWGEKSVGERGSLIRWWERVGGIWGGK